MVAPVRPALRRRTRRRPAGYGNSSDRRKSAAFALPDAAETSTWSLMHGRDDDEHRLGGAALKKPDRLSRGVAEHAKAPPPRGAGGLQGMGGGGGGGGGASSGKAAGISSNRQHDGAIVDGTTKANVIDEDDDRSTPEGRARYMAARRASAVPSVEGPGRHVERASQREKLEVIEAQKAEAKAEAVREASRKNSVHMRAEAEASGDGEGTRTGGTDVWAYHGLFSVSVLRACAA